MTRPLTLLLTSAGRRVELLRCFMADAEALGIRLRTVAADLAPDLSAACAIADRAVAAPRCTDAGYGAFLADLCAREGVDLLVPTIDPELPAIAQMRESLTQAGVMPVISAPHIVALARDKLATARDLSAAGLKTPGSWTLDEARALGAAAFPLIVKPRDGSSSNGIQIIGSPGELAGLDPADRRMAQQLLAGDEYTVNMYFDRDGVLKAVVPHRRIETRAGEVSKAQTQRLPALEDMGWALGEALAGARGPLCFQAFVARDGDACLFEINARFGGGYPVAHRAGAPFTRWLLEEAAGLASTANNDWRGDVRMLRFDAAVFS